MLSTLCLGDKGQHFYLLNNSYVEVIFQIFFLAFCSRQDQTSFKERTLRKGGGGKGLIDMPKVTELVTGA